MMTQPPRLTSALQRAVWTVQQGQMCELVSERLYMPHQCCDACSITMCRIMAVDSWQWTQEGAFVLHMQYQCLKVFAMHAGCSYVCCLWLGLILLRALI